MFLDTLRIVFLDTLPFADKNVGDLSLLVLKGTDFTTGHSFSCFQETKRRVEEARVALQLTKSEAFLKEG